MHQGDHQPYALPGIARPRPRQLRDPGRAGAGVPPEILSLPVAGFGRFVAAIPQPLGIVKIAMDDGIARSGVLRERRAIGGAVEVSPDERVSHTGGKTWPLPARHLSANRGREASVIETADVAGIGTALAAGPPATRRHGERT